MSQNKTLLLIFVIFPLILLPSRASAAPSPAQEIVPLGSYLYGGMDALYAISGMAPPSGSRPWSKAEAAYMLDRVDRSGLSPEGMDLYDALSGLLASGPKFALRDGFGLGAGFDAFLEAYYKSDTAFGLESDWIYGFERRKPMAKVSLDFSLKDFLYLYCDAQYGRNRFNIADDLRTAVSVYPGGIGAVIAPGDTNALIALNSSIYSKPFLTNILEKAVDFDYQWPKRAVASLGGPNWNLSLARDKLSWGNGRIGNFIVDSHVDYHEYARLIAFSDMFRYEWLLLFMEANPNPGEYYDSGFKTLLAHRLEFRPWNNLSLTVSENVMYQNDSFDLRYLNPAFIYHNLNNRSMFNAIAHAEIDWNLGGGLSLYGQYAMDQGRAPTESAAQADATGILAGMAYAAPAKGGYLSTSLEFAKTDPLLYRRDGIDFLMMRKYYTNGDPTGPGYVIELDYAGFPYGGDALILQWKSEYVLTDKATLGFTLFGMRHGEMNFYLSHNKDGLNGGYADYEGTTPSGDTISETAAAILEGELLRAKLLGFAEAKLWLHSAFVFRRTYDRPSDSYGAWSPDVQLTAGMGLSL